MESSNNATGIAEYEDYTSVSKTYDEIRKPVGLESLDKALELASQRLGKEKKSLKLLDVGCGTGNYINALKTNWAPALDWSSMKACWQQPKLSIKMTNELPSFREVLLKRNALKPKLTMWSS